MALLALKMFHEFNLVHCFELNFSNNAPANLTFMTSSHMQNHYFKTVCSSDPRFNLHPPDEIPLVLTILPPISLHTEHKNGRQTGTCWVGFKK